MDNSKRVGIERDEWYPVYTISEKIESYQDYMVVVPQELVDRYKAVREEFRKVQNELSKLYEERKPTRNKFKHDRDEERFMKRYWRERQFDLARLADE